MFKKIIFALIILIIAISSVSATDINSTCDEDSNFNMISNNISDVSLTEFDDVGLADTDSDALAAAKTVYFDASASTDGLGTKSNPYKYLYSGRITSGMTAYFANGVYSFSGTGKIGYNSLYKTTFIGQSKDKTIIRSTASYSFDLIVSSNSNLVLKDLTFDYGHIVNSGNVEAENVIFKNSVCSYTSTSSSVGSYSCGGVIYSNASKGSTCSINLKNCNFQSNEAKHGGVISANYTNIVITNCVFQNSISNRSGGAIYSLNSNITISKSSLGIYSFEIS